MSGAAESSLHPGIALPLALFLVFANAVFVASEFALVQVRPGQLESMAKEGSSSARRALRLLEHLDETLAVCQVGVTLASLGLGWLGEPAFAAIFHWIFSPTEAWIGPLSLTLSLGASFLLITVMHIVFGEQVPKYAAIADAGRLACWTAWPTQIMGLVSRPLVVGLNGMVQMTLRPFGLAGVNDAGTHGAEEIHQILAHSVRQGRIRRLDAELIDNLLRFSRRRVREIMVPRSRTVMLDLEDSPDAWRRVVAEEGFSRYPVAVGDLDRVVGVVHVKDLLPALSEGQDEVDLRRLVREVLLVPETLPIQELLRRFQRFRGHLALVVDEYGGIAGIVTLEDVIEELVGEVRDEFDEEERDPVRPRPGGGYLLDPLLPVDLAAELVDDPPEPPEGITSVAGLIHQGLGRLPRKGDRVPFGVAHLLVASQVEGPRIVQVELVPEALAGEAATEN
ncbi:MAG: hemolysin family protein [Acidobacteriota bacterium]|nr:hemolysin family protein [Acidobacteriota bacterium]MDQ7088993.1 hemolysin family protein [Acidobacteriota bacterium]